MVTESVRSALCPSEARPGRPCAPAGDHVSRYLRAEATGSIRRSDLRSAIAALTVLAPNAVVPARGRDCP